MYIYNIYFSFSDLLSPKLLVIKTYIFKQYKLDGYDVHIVEIYNNIVFVITYYVCAHWNDFRVYTM